MLGSFKEFQDRLGVLMVDKWGIYDMGYPLSTPSLIGSQSSVLALFAWGPAAPHRACCAPGASDRPSGSPRSWRHGLWGSLLLLEDAHHKHAAKGAHAVPFSSLRALLKGTRTFPRRPARLKPVSACAKGNSTCMYRSACAEAGEFQVGA